MRWIKTDIGEIQYFENCEEQSLWHEYQKGKLFSKFIEVDRNLDKNGELEVLILKTNGLFVKLTSNGAFWGYAKDDTGNYLSNGRWEKYIKVSNVNENDTENKSNNSFQSKVYA